MKRILGVLCVVGLLLTGTCGCVERILTIDSNPGGALVEINPPGASSEVGRTPVSFDFTWYGVYSVTLRRDGYQTLKTKGNVIAPLYEWVPLDLISELLPIPLKDHHFITFTLIPAGPATEPGPDVLQTAQHLKSQLESTHYPTTKPSK
jgi:hypothetical protein